MKLWKKTVLLMVVTLLAALLLVSGMTLYITGKRSISNTAETYGTQLNTAAKMLEQFWENDKYQKMTKIGRNSYRNFQFRLCCGEGFALIKDGAVVENLTEYDIVDADALKTDADRESLDYRIQRLGRSILMLQETNLTNPTGYTLFSVRDITEIYREIARLAAWYLGISCVIFCMGGVFIYRMMHKTVRAMEELQDVAGRQEILLGALAHEMKTPLTSIIGYSDSLLHVKLKEEQKLRALEQINREGKRMEQLSAKMLQLMGLYQNDAVHMEEHRAEEVLRHLAERAQKNCMENGIQLQTEWEDFSVKIDLELVESMFLNLIDNAVRASKPGDKIILRAKKEDMAKIFAVEDRGRGIPKEELEKVTQAFYMVDKSRSRRMGGAGLGLALCQRIAELHHGKLDIQSEEGKGTIVTVRFL